MLLRELIQNGATSRIADTARVIGDVELGHDASVWFGAVIRGDVAGIRIGAGTNVQDHVMIHCDSGYENVIGSRVTIGHNAVVHGESIGDGTLIGMHATVMGRTRIGNRCLVAAGAVVPPGLVVPDDQVVMGVPGRVVRPTNDKEKQYLRWLASHYVELAKRYISTPDAPALRRW